MNGTTIFKAIQYWLKPFSLNFFSFNDSSFFLECAEVINCFFYQADNNHILKDQGELYELYKIPIFVWFQLVGLWNE